ncbi:hypothetical protein E4U60_007363, partial [Claviceps pazoutovae]
MEDSIGVDVAGQDGDDADHGNGGDGDGEDDGNGDNGAEEDDAAVTKAWKIECLHSNQSRSKYGGYGGSVTR